MKGKEIVEEQRGSARKSMIAYKHISDGPEDRLPTGLTPAESFEAGISIQLGLFSTYRAMEGDRADPLEGVAEYHVPAATAAHLQDGEFAHARAIMGIRGTMHESCLFQDNTVRRILRDNYIFCCSSEPDLSRIDLGERIYEIHQLDNFAHRLTVAAFGTLSFIRIGPVTYEKRSANPFLDRLLVEDAFRKSDRFQPEHEIRVVWDTLTDAGPFLRLRSPRAAKLVSRVA